MNSKYINFFKNKTILITGNTGFKGSWLSLSLIMMGAKVIGLSKDIPTNPSLYKILGLNKIIKQHFIEISNYNQVSKVIDSCKPDIIFHLAAQSLVSESYKNPLKTLITNAIGTATILEAIKTIKHKVSVICITSDKAYENKEWVWGYRENDVLGGRDIYSASKSSAENIISAYFSSFFNSNKYICIASARAGNVIGGGDWSKDRIIVDIIKAWYDDKPVTIRSPNSTRPWQHVLEPLSGYIKIAMMLKNKSNINGEPFNFGPNDINYTVKNLVTSIAHELNNSNKKLKINFKKNVFFNESNLLSLNCDKSKILLNWEPYLNYQQTIKLVSSWYYNYYYDRKNIVNFTRQQIENYFQNNKL